MGTSRPTPAALQILHYLAPTLVVFYFFAARTAASCLLHRPAKQAGNKTRRYVVTTLLFAAAVTVIAESATYAIQSLSRPGFWASQNVVIYLLLSTLIYGSMLLTLLGTKKPIWHPYLGAGIVAFIFEVPILVLQAITGGSSGRFAFSRLMLHVARVLILSMYIAAGAWSALHSRPRKSEIKSETAPLLNGSAAHANLDSVKPNGYGAILENDNQDDDGDEADLASILSLESDSDPDDPSSETRKKQQKRLQEAGSWITYLLEFKVFLPLLWPSRDRFVQACLVAIAVVLLIERFLNVLQPRELGIIVDELTKNYGTGEFPWQPTLIWMMLSFLGSRAGVSLIRNLAELPVQQFAFKSLGSAAFSHVMHLSMDFHNDKNSGELIRAIDQGRNLHGLLEFACFEVTPMFVDLAVAFVYVYTLFDIYMSLILVVAGAAYTWVGITTTSWSVKRRRKFNAAWRNESKVQVAAISNWQTVSHFNRSQYECERYEDAIDEFNRSEMGYYLSYYIGGSAQSLIMVTCRLAAAALAIYKVSQGIVPIGNFITLTAYWPSIESPLAQVSWSIRRLTSMLTDSERLLQLLTTRATVSDAPGAVNLHVDAGHVEFQHVGFAYDARRTTLKDVSFTAKPGQTIALVGETGGGKSTILKLLYRYYDTSSGVIRIDGQDISAVTLDSLRETFGMVPQDPALFNISIMENVRYARLDATDDEVQNACRAAAIHDKIETFPDKYQSTVGERGVKLSGGELQRVAIARAILRQPKIVLLDEATSMIDAETESLIQAALKRLTADRTTFVIAHRLSTVQHADRIIVIHDGEIVESGNHDELFQRKGKYFALWSKQLSKDVKAIGDTLHVGKGSQPVIDATSSDETGNDGRDESTE